MLRVLLLASPLLARREGGGAEEVASPRCSSHVTTLMSSFEPRLHACVSLGSCGVVSLLSTTRALSDKDKQMDAQHGNA